MAYQIIPDVTPVLMGAGPGRVFRGSYYEDLEGRGFMSSAFKEILPLLGRKIAREAVRVGSDILQDVRSGMSLKEAAKLGIHRTLERARKAAVKRLSGEGQPIKARRGVPPSKRRRM
jgi:hypothetical protein